ncbi:hypothetical protein BRD17_07615 [Halobacteriales archaeon SW_7_68_16]|nr:MAG: hypothetical protein BRD17_07615 [Halobacteriales archaeon SW_7_68_16]
MSWRTLTDENVEPATRNYLKKLGHDIEHVVTVDALGQSVSDAEIAEYARRTDRVILTQDNDSFVELDVKRDTGGVLYQQDQEISARQAGDVVQFGQQLRIVLDHTPWRPGVVVNARRLAVPLGPRTLLPGLAVGTPVTDDDVEADLRAQLTEAFEGADYPVDNQMDLVPALPNGPTTRFEAGDVSVTAMELASRLGDTQEFPYDDVESLVDDVIAGMREKGLL